jgi:hypothetical protein
MKEPKLPINVDERISNQTKHRVQAEITNLERQLVKLNIESEGVDFALVATYKEMIKSRQDLLSDLPKSF